MKYIKQLAGHYAAIDESSELYGLLSALPDSKRPVFLAETHPAVIAWLAAQVEAKKPKEVTMRQARLALHETGRLASVEAAIAAMPGDAGITARIEWEFASSLKRTSALVLAIGAGLGLTDTVLDHLFAVAASK